MTQEDYRHPITPPPELVQQWTTEYTKTKPNCLGTEFVANRAAQWGADQELEACVKWLEWNHSDLLSRDLRVARRSSPKTPSLKEQALALLDKAEDPSWDINDFSIVRRALEQLDD